MRNSELIHSTNQIIQERQIHWIGRFDFSFGANFKIEQLDNTNYGLINKEIKLLAANSVYKPLLAAGLRMLVTFGYLVLTRQQSALNHATAHTRGRWQ